MSTTTAAKETTATIDIDTLERVLREGYGPGAWHGADMKEALAGVSPELAFWRPAPERHSIAEIALHHAYCARSVRGRLAGTAPGRFLLEGEDWFTLEKETSPSWEEILSTVDAEQRRLTEAVEELGSGRAPRPAPAEVPLDLVLGITCHAVYHAGQVQLIKRLHG
jgi:hypothetical protein